MYHLIDLLHTNIVLVTLRLKLTVFVIVKITCTITPIKVAGGILSSPKFKACIHSKNIPYCRPRCRLWLGVMIMQNTIQYYSRINFTNVEKLNM